jgi:hypothetical protein
LAALNSSRHAGQSTRLLGSALAISWRGVAKSAALLLLSKHCETIRPIEHLSIGFLASSPAEYDPPEARLGDGEIDGAYDEHRHHGPPDERDVGAAEQRRLREGDAVIEAQALFGARLPKLIEELTDAPAA